MIPGLTMEVHAGASIDEAAREAQRIADATDRTVLFEFNGVRCIAWPQGRAEKLVELQQEAQRTRLTVYSNGSTVEMERRDDR